MTAEEARKTLFCEKAPSSLSSLSHCANSKRPAAAAATVSGSGGLRNSLFLLSSFGCEMGKRSSLKEEEEDGGASCNEAATTTKNGCE